MERDRENEGIPQSQRTTIPTPMPFAAAADRVKPSVGHYMIINERAAERLRLTTRSGPRS